MKIKLFLFIILPSIYLISCNSGKHVSGFNDIRKNIDTLEILPIDVKINTVDYFNKQFIDENLENIVQTNIINQVSDILSKKYVLIINNSLNYQQAGLEDGLEQLGDYLETQKKTIEEADMPVGYKKKNLDFMHRYSIIIQVRAQYCINFPQQNNTLWLNTVGKTYLKERIFLVDNLTNKVVYFKELKNTSEINQSASVEQMTMNCIRDIYYK